MRKLGNALVSKAIRQCKIQKRLLALVISLMCINTVTASIKTVEELADEPVWHSGYGKVTAALGYSCWVEKGVIWADKNCGGPAIKVRYEHPDITEMIRSGVSDYDDWAGPVKVWVGEQEIHRKEELANKLLKDTSISTPNFQFSILVTSSRPHVNYNYDQSDWSSKTTFYLDDLKETYEVIKKRENRQARMEAITHIAIRLAILVVTIALLVSIAIWTTKRITKKRRAKMEAAEATLIRHAYLDESTRVLARQHAAENPSSEASAERLAKALDATKRKPTAQEMVDHFAENQRTQTPKKTEKNEGDQP